MPHSANSCIRLRASARAEHKQVRAKRGHGTLDPKVWRQRNTSIRRFSVDSARDAAFPRACVAAIMTGWCTGTTLLRLWRNWQTR